MFEKVSILPPLDIKGNWSCFTDRDEVDVFCQPRPQAFFSLRKSERTRAVLSDFRSVQKPWERGWHFVNFKLL